MQKSGYISSPKVNQANPEVSRANAQSRFGGILIVLAIGKLCFALLTSFSAVQNNLPFGKGGMHSEVVHPFLFTTNQYVRKEKTAFGRTQAQGRPRRVPLFGQFQRGGTRRVSIPL
jgi:hypothetical protein